MLSGEQKRVLKERAIAETKTFVGIVAYAWVVLSLFDIHKLIVLRQLHLDSPVGFKLGLNLVTAIVLGKVVLIGQSLHLAERFKDRPVIYPILFRSAVFAVLLVLFEIVEDVVIGMVHGKTMAQSIPQLGGGGLEGKILVAVMLFVVLIPLFTFLEIRRVLGYAELHSLIFKERTKAGAAHPGTR